MAKYSGKASVVTTDGTTIEEVQASLVSRVEDTGDASWFGTISGDFDAFDLMDGEATLLLPEGGRSTFSLSRTDLVLPRKGVDILGTGPSPF